MKSVKSAIYTESRARNRPSMYADPVAWAVLDFASTIIEELGDVERANVGLLAISDVCSLSTMRLLSDSSKNGKISPLRFAGANPGIIAGLTAIEYKLRGPSLVLTMSPERAVAVVLPVLKYWIEQNGVAKVILVAHEKNRDLNDVLRGVIIKKTEKFEEKTSNNINFVLTGRS